MVGRTVLQYQLGEKLGAGGMGEVYKALDTRLNRFVAIKVLPASLSSDPEYRRRFIQEAQAASALNHPNIITIYDAFQEGDTQYMVVELVMGKTLLELTPLPFTEAVRYASQIADALTTAHEAGIIHRDLKPANVMVNNSGRVKLLDFGLAKVMAWSAGDHSGTTATVINEPLTMAGAIMGSVNYMSPEQASGRALDARSDIFSFGAVFYEMLTGRKAFPGDSPVETLSSILRDEPAPMTGVPPEAERIVMRCLRKDPNQRFQSMREVSTALGNALGEYSPPTVRTIAPPPPVKRKSAMVPIGIVLLMLMLAVAAAWWIFGRAPAGPVSQTPVTSSKPGQQKPGPSTPPETQLERPVTIAVNLSDGTPIRLSLASDIPAGAKPGTPVLFKAAEDLTIDGSIVVAAGATVNGSIVDAAKKKFLGIGGGKMTFRLGRADAAGGQRLILRATPARAKDGVSKRQFGSPVSKEIAAVAGTEYSGYIDGPQTLLVRK